MWWRTAYSSLYRHPVHALHQYEVRAEHLAGCLHREALTITGYALYAVAVGLTGSMYMVSITALSACGVWCRAQEQIQLWIQVQDTDKHQQYALITGDSIPYV